MVNRGYNRTLIRFYRINQMIMLSNIIKYMPPFEAHGLMVLDNDMQEVCECYCVNVALYIAKMLNDKANYE